MANRQSIVSFFVLILFPFAWSSSQHNALSASQVLAISSNGTIVSPHNTFELGFFKLSTSTEDGDRWYLGIWYKAISPREYIWVANREHPLYNSSGALNISNSNLLLLNQFGTLVWSSNVVVPFPPSSPVVAELLDNGNFVLRYSDNRDSFLWQSFDFPTDTLLPGMDLTKGPNRSLSSWKSRDDPSVGQFSYKMIGNNQVLPEMFLWRGTKLIYRSGLGDISWETAIAFREKEKRYLQLKVTHVGVLQQSSWSPTTQHLDVLRAVPYDKCDVYRSLCGSNSVCGSVKNDDTHVFQSCTCFNGFKPKYPVAWWFRFMRDGCKRKTRLSCHGNGFQPLKNVKLPDTKNAILERSIGLKGCRKRCLKDCNCTGFANVDMGISGFDCLIYTSDLVDIRTLVVGGHAFYVKVADTDLGKGRGISGKFKGLIIAATIAILIVLSFAMFWWRWKSIQKRTRTIARNTDLPLDGDLTDLVGANGDVGHRVPRMEFQTIREATNNFCDSNKLGQGGFGIVYKGILIDGKEIAVKRLTKVSHEGTSQFLNEVNLISNVQHINLVRLIGYCIHGEERMLVLEYHENRSLDFYLFGNPESSRLTWQVRYEIIHGIARGLMYLHQDSFFRIIHRDLKASNILLDKDMIPKISDFGMARLVGRDETQTNTRVLAGTKGYMSPEYMNYGLFSDKSDVYSFGVMLLELLSGKRNYRFMNSNGDTSLLSWVWRNWEQERLPDIVDPFLLDSSSSPSTVFQIVRSFQIGLLCVQERAEDRPEMASVVVMLESAAAVPQPKPPGYCDHYATTTTTVFEIGSTSTGPVEPLGPEVMSVLVAR